jgi:1-acyl-sn-glycerol-3-phosphate acyltransferase
VPHPQNADRAYRVVARIVRPALFAMTRTDWHGAENLPQGTGFIAVGNHVTNLDPLTFAHFLYDNGVVPRILAKASLFTVPVLGRVLRATRQVPVHRDSVRAGDSLRSAVAALEQGEVVAIFPEGTLTKDPDLWPMTAKTGVARLALTTQAPVIPIAQWGAHRVLGPRSKVLKPFPRKKVTVVAGPAVDLSDLAERPLDAAVLREATDRVMAAITVMLEEIRGEQAPAEPFGVRRADAAPASDGDADAASTDAGPTSTDADGEAL